MRIGTGALRHAASSDLPWLRGAVLRAEPLNAHQDTELRDETRIAVVSNQHALMLQYQ